MNNKFAVAASKRPHHFSCALLALTLCACGADDSNSTAAQPSAAPSTSAAAATATSTLAPKHGATATPPVPVGAADAARLLEQATFGVTASDIAHVQSIGIDAYINEQLAYPATQYTGCLLYTSRCV